MSQTYKSDEQLAVEALQRIADYLERIAEAQEEVAKYEHRKNIGE